MSYKDLFWRLRYSRWPARAGDLGDGYSVLVPVPGDLPALAELALSVLRRQESANRLRTVLVPDQPSPAIEAIVARERPAWPGELRLARLALPERWFVHRLRSASRIHWLQVVTGMGQVSSTYALLHDADLFLLDDNVLEERFVLARDRDLACLGVNPVWDEWYAAKGRSLVATWEMLASVTWFRSFSPVMHGPHDASIWGEVHTFDTTLHPQALTDQARLQCEPIEPAKMVNFNYAIATYRMFQHHQGTFLDGGYRLLLLSVLLDLYGSTCDVPPLATLAGGLTKAGGRVAFPSPDKGAAKYASFRHSLHSVLRSHLVSPEAAERVEQHLGRFDEYYAWAGAEHA